MMVVTCQFQALVCWRLLAGLLLSFFYYHPSAFIIAVAAAAELSSASLSEQTMSNPSVILGEVGSNLCPEGYKKINDYRMCIAAMDIIGPGNADLDPTGGAYPAESFEGTETESDFPSGCYTFDDEETKCTHLVYFNDHPTGKEASFATPICVGKQKLQLETVIKVGDTTTTLYMGDSDIDYWSPPRPSSTSSSYNVGRGGDTCEDVMGDVAPFFDYFHPSIVVLVCGSNDLIEETVATTFNRFQNAVVNMNQRGSAVIYMGTKNDPSSPELWKDYADYDNAVRDHATTNCDTTIVAAGGRRPAFTFIDVNAAFNTDANNEDARNNHSESLLLYAPDQLHLSDEGYALWSEWVTTALQEPNCCIWQSNECVQYTSSTNTTTTATITPFGNLSGTTTYTPGVCGFFSATSAIVLLLYMR
mmetsp:Transcript_28732/g.32227  ORF Transcript_28732/g.32227 Transcript_28732/m.32227 type:complete len:418 (-) Transcript_28732:136-1389(-)